MIPYGAFQNLVGEHSIAGVPPSLYNLTKSVPDPWAVGSIFCLDRELIIDGDGHIFFQSQVGWPVLPGVDRILLFTWHWINKMQSDQCHPSLV